MRLDEVAFPCPLCGATDGRELHRHRGRIVRCQACGLVRRDPIPGPDALAQIYRHPAYFKASGRGEIGYGGYVEDETIYRPYFRRKIGQIGRARRPPGRFLEIGAATGYALDEARRAGWSVRGLELSPSAAAYARATFGLDVREGGFEEIADVGTYDVIAAFQTIEHTPDVRRAIRRMRRALRPGGVLALTTPDHGSWVRRLSGPLWPSYRPEHIVYFDRVTLCRILEDEGFRVLSVRADDPLLVPLSRIRERVAHYYGARWVTALPVPAVRVPIWLGDMFAVASPDRSGALTDRGRTEG